MLTGSGYGRTVALRVAPPAVAAARAALPWWWRDTTVEPEAVWTVDRPDDAVPAVRAVELWVAEHAVDRVFVHAAVVARAGRALLLPGPSATGKTTLTAELLRRGASYCSDEYAVLDAHGRVHPYPRPLSLRTGAGRVATAPGTFGAGILGGPVPVAAVASCRYAPGARWSPEEVAPAQAVLDVLANTVCARSDPERALAAVSAAVGSATAVAGERGEAGETAERLLALLGQGTM